MMTTVTRSLLILIEAVNYTYVQISGLWTRRGRFGRHPIGWFLKVLFGGLQQMCLAQSGISLVKQGIVCHAGACRDCVSGRRANVVVVVADYENVNRKVRSIPEVARLIRL